MQIAVLDSDLKQQLELSAALVSQVQKKQHSVQDKLASYSTQDMSTKLQEIVNDLKSVKIDKDLIKIRTTSRQDPQKEEDTAANTLSDLIDEDSVNILLGSFS